MLQNITIHFSGDRPQEPLVLQQGDYGSRQVQAALFDAPGVPSDLRGATVTLLVRCGGEDHPAFEGQVVGEHHVRFLLPAAAAKEAGSGLLQLRVYKDGGLLHSGLIPLMVRLSLEESEDAPDPEPAFASLLTQLMQAAAGYANPPRIGADGCWQIYQPEEEEYVSTNISAYGAGIRVQGSVSSIKDLPGNAAAGDAYLIGGRMYVFSRSGLWLDAGNVQGIKGADGFSPVVQLSKKGPVSTLTITDARGAKTTTIRDGGVQTVAGIAPDEQGNVIITPADIGAAAQSKGPRLSEHPVGSWWISDDPTSPAELMGGTWESMAGRVLLGAGKYSDSITYTQGQTGGAAGKNITKNHLPTDAVVSVINSGESTLNVTGYSSSSGNEWTSGTYKTVTVRTAANNGVITREMLDVMQPYYVTYMWRRVA